MRSLLVVLLSVFALLLTAGCGNVDAGAGAGTPKPGETPGPGDDDDDDDGATPYDPGTPPTEIGGMAAFGRFHDSNSNDFIGMVNLFPVPVPLPPNFSDVWYGSPSVPVDTCLQVYPSSVGVSSNILPPSPGDLSLEGPNGTMTLSPIMDAMYLSIWNDVGMFQPVTTYTFKATGGQIEAFEQPLLSPGEVTTLTPDVTAQKPFPIARNQPFTLTWLSVPDGNPLFLYFRQQDSPESYEYLWMCKVEDDGAFTVPANVLPNFGSTVEPWVGEDWRDGIELRRARYSSFFPEGAVGPIIVAFESGWFAEVRFQ